MYYPSEDTFLLIRGLERGPSLGIVLEIGVGSGKVAEVLGERADMYVGCDIDRRTLNQIVHKTSSRTELVCCDSANCFINNYFDTIVFNPPYLPSEEIVDQTVDGGRKGNEIIFKFLNSSFKLLKPDGSIFFISSSLANEQELKDFIKKKKFDYEILIREHFLFEDIYLSRCRKLS
jgi:release factor glutamine methyltransferase